MGFFNPEDRCVTDASGARAGPSTLSTVLLVLHGLPLMVSLLLWLPVVLLVVVAPTAHDRRRTTAHLMLGISSACLGYALYIQYQRRCRPWTGWLLYATVGNAVQLASLLALWHWHPVADEDDDKKAKDAVHGHG